MNRTTFLIGIGLLGLAGAFISAAVAEPPDADARCEDLSGAPFGLCTAAVNVGCDSEDSRTPGCTKIEDKFEQITGETPPWTIPICMDNSECGEGEFCETAAGDCGGTGVCSTTPPHCVDATFPAVGCDLGEYVNFCVAHTSGVNILCYHPPGIDPAHTEPVCP